MKGILGGNIQILLNIDVLEQHVLVSIGIFDVTSVFLKGISEHCAYLICFLGHELGWPEQGTRLGLKCHSRPQSCWGTGEELPTRTGSRGEGRGLKKEKPVQSVLFSLRSLGDTEAVACHRVCARRG